MIKRPSPRIESAPGSGALVGIVLGLTAVICLMLLAFSTPAIHSGPHDLPLAVSGPEPAVAQLRTTLDENRPDAFAVKVHATSDDVASAIKERAAVGGISIAPDGITIQVASAAGAPYVSLLRNIGSGFASQGQPVKYIDVAPLTSDDPNGSGVAALALPLALGGTLSAVALATMFRRSRTRRIVGSLAFSMVAGLAATVLLRFVLGTVDGAFWGTSAAVGLGIAAISLTVLGLESLLGYVGIGVGALTMVFVANPLSGIASGSAWLPQPWGDIGQFLPIGAAGTLIRSTAFFDGAGSVNALLVLGGWVILGLSLLAMSTRRHSPTEVTSAS
ncbi:hypothetical protein [Nocardioides jensenii]|uniref:hypothetical protein n=1 Tax=Nocardioides jensenii TaxID=1843 RepID=UPI000831FDDD|nr:hypothetical protein [Nocardioides jensenii]